MSDSETLVILGAGHAGGRAAAALRKKGYEGRIQLVGDETDPPYERPPLSKEALTEGADPLVNRINDEAFYRDNAIELLLGQRAEALDPAARHVTLERGTELGFDRLIFATGCRARTLPLPGAEHARVLTLRSAADCRRLAPLLKPGAKVVLIGGGFIGLEIAAGAAKLGCEVTVLEAQQNLLERALAPRVGAFMGKLHRDAGVDIATGVEVEQIVHGDSGSAVELADGRRFDADLVVLGVGAALNDEIARAGGLACDNGILVDAACRTAAEGVYAIGDVTHHENTHLARRVRLESWENAEIQADVVAQTILGEEAACSSVPWFWTDQHGVNLQLLGYGEIWDEEILRGDPEEGAFTALYLRDGRIVMAALANAGRERRPLKQLIEARAEVPAAQLAGSETSLRDLAKALKK